jgi:sialate O-acetylesterase
MIRNTFSLKIDDHVPVKLVWLAAIAVLAASPASAQLRFANVFGDNMVLQREKEVTVWGWAEADAEVIVTITENGETALPYLELERQRNDNSYSVTVEYREENVTPFNTRSRAVRADDAGYWQATFDEMAGSFAPKFLMAQSGGQGVAIGNILIGEVWVCGGQSNMEWDDSMARDLEGPGAIFPGVRYTKVGETWYQPLSDLRRPANWVECSPERLLAETDKDLAIIPFFFAQYVHRYLKVPVGIINTARGGTLGISWAGRQELDEIDAAIVKDILRDYDAETALWEDESYGDRVRAEYDAGPAALMEQWEKDAEVARAKGEDPPPEPEVPDRPTDPRDAWTPPTGMFNASIEPIGMMTIRGALYYQGENNFFGYMPQYEYTFPKVISSFRRVFNDPDLPFGIITLPGWGRYGTPVEHETMPGGGGYAIIRDIHTRAAESDPDADVITTYDTGNSWIHPWVKRPVGDRAARWALAEVYGQEVRWRGPKFAESRIVGNRIYAYFTPDPTMSQNRDDINGMPNWMATPVGRQGNDAELTGYSIAGSDRRWYPAEVRRNDEENCLMLSSPFVEAPVAIRYGWANWPTGNSGCNIGHPTPTFRTDDWPIQGPQDDEGVEQLRRSAERQAAERRTKEGLAAIQENWRDGIRGEEAIAFQLDLLEKARANLTELGESGASGGNETMRKSLEQIEDSITDIRAGMKP